MNCPYEDCDAELTGVGPLAAGQTITCATCKGTIEVVDDDDGLILVGTDEDEDDDGGDDAEGED